VDNDCDEPEEDNVKGQYGDCLCTSPIKSRNGRHDEGDKGAKNIVDLGSKGGVRESNKEILEGKPKSQGR